jgi:hypothetical protein
MSDAAILTALVTSAESGSCSVTPTDIVDVVAKLAAVTG